MQLPEPESLKLVVRRYAEVLESLELSPGEQPLVLPTNEWFPDRFTGDQASVEALVARMQGYAGLEDTEIETLLTGAAAEGASCGPSGCGSGACGTSKPAADGPRLARLEHGFRIEMPGTAVSHPIAFTASVARLLGHVRLAVAEDGRSADPMQAELAATALGFGVLLLEASYIYSKSCGGPSVGTATALSLGELALPEALFLAMEGHTYRDIASELSTTQRAIMAEAWALADSNRSLIELLKTRPDRVKAGHFQLGEARSWLQRLFSKKKKPAVSDPAQAALAALERGESVDSVAALLGSSSPAPRTPARRTTPKDDIDDLVGEALAELRGADRPAAE